MNYISYYIEINEGIGSLLQYILSFYYLSKIKNLNFVYNNLSNIEHNSWGNYSNKDWDNKWNSYIINYFLPNNILHIDDILSNKNINIVNNYESHKDYKQYENTLFLFNNRLVSKIYLDKFINTFPEIINNLSDNYHYNTKHLHCYYENNKINIAIHIRKFTKTDCCNSDHREYYIKNGEIDNYFFTLMTNLIKLLHNKNIDFHIFTQISQDEDTNIFDHYFNLKNDKINIHLHTGNDTFSDIHHIIKADIILMSKSSFSAICNYYTKGICLIRHSYIHTLKNSNTIYVNKNGNINDIDKKTIINFIINKI